MELLDVLVCNAASNPYYGDLEKIPDELFDKIMNNNVKSNLWLCKKSIPYLKKNKLFNNNCFFYSRITRSKKFRSIFYFKNC